MIDDEVNRILTEPGDRGDALNSLADQFRGGRDICDLLPLLKSEDLELIGIGAWIVGEINVDEGNIEEIRARLNELLGHETPSIRFQAISALYPMLDAGDPSTITILRGLARDSNEGVRAVAQAALDRGYG